VLSRIEGWEAKTLSQAGRLVLIKLVAAAIPSYAMSSFLLPISCCKELDKVFKKIWWGFPSKKTKNLSLKAWNSICIPKVLGGLRSRKMRDVNLALIAKLGWKMLTNPDSLWVAPLKGKYLHSNSFLSPHPFLLLSHGFGKAFLNLIPSFPKVPTTSSIAPFLFLYRVLLGFLP
jgi:hypothetical protein